MARYAAGNTPRHVVGIGASALAELPPDLLARYFQNRSDGYQVVPELRQMIVFAPHNILRDAPFTDLDFVSCRNLLIYLRPTRIQMEQTIRNQVTQRERFLAMLSHELRNPFHAIRSAALVVSDDRATLDHRAAAATTINRQVEIVNHLLMDLLDTVRIAEKRITLKLETFDLRERGTKPRRLVALTGYGKTTEVQKAFDSGFDDHMVKPLDPKRLQQLIDQVMRTTS